MLLEISEVAEEIKLSKIDDKPWGFRLTGGLDFGTPVTVIKVTAGSLAEQAGMKVGDILLEANGNPLSYLTHHESHKLFLEAGNFIELLVVRGSLVLAPPIVPQEATEGNEVSQQGDEVSQQGDAINRQGESQSSSSTRLQKQAPKELSLFESIFGPLDEQIEETFVENVIQEVLMDQQLESGVDEPHLIQELAESQRSETDAVENTEQTVTPQEPETDIKITPEQQEVNEQQTEMFTEEVKRELTEEDIVDIMTGHAEVLKGTTIGVDFDKLNPKSEIIDKSEVLQALKEDETESEKKKLTTFLQVPNRPKIKPKEKPKQQPQKQIQDSSEVEGTKEEEETYEPKVEEDIQLSEKEEQDKNKVEEQEINMSEEQNGNKVDQQEMNISEEENRNKTNEQEMNMSEEQAKEEKRSEDVEDLRLLEIQNQLSALLQLPTVMQEQLAVLQQQVANIVQQKLAALQPSAEQENMPVSEEPNQKETEVSDERNEEADGEGEKVEDINQMVEGEESVQEGGKSVQEGGESVQEGGESVQEDEKSTVETGNQENAQSQHQEDNTTNTAEKEQSEGRKRDIKREKPKRNKPFFPLTPHPRPIILPGKIKFQMNPEEAYDDEFIAETMSGNAEVIIGNAIGVNFQKYQRNYDHLKSSSVYRMIHESEGRSPGAFRGRPEKLLANEDYKLATEVREQQDA